MAISKEQLQERNNYNRVTQQQYQVRDNYVYEAITVHRGLVDMGEDTYRHGRGSEVDYQIEYWKNTDEGQWCMEKAVDWQTMKEPDHAAFGYRYAVRCLFTPKDATFYRMKWG